MTPSPKTLIPYLTAGFPSRPRTLDLMKACADAGADAIELGIPFSDPMADGPVIQAASQQALDQGMTMEEGFRMVERFRRTHVTPVYFMTYFNPILQFILPRFFHRAAQHGLAGVVIPDLPPEEAGGALAVSRRSRVPLVFLCASTCSDDRLRRIDRLSKSFIYLVSLKGVTGSRVSLAPGLERFVRRARLLTRRPLYVGFGISTPAQAARVAAMADGVIVGSAILKRVQEGASAREVGRFVASLRRAVS
jgi:tryptophan synthase alpha chain